MKVYQFIRNNKVVSEVFYELCGRDSLLVTSYLTKDIMDFNIKKYLDKKQIGIEDFDTIKEINKCDFWEEQKLKPIIIKKLEKLNKISKKRWLSKFPSSFPNEIWNGHWAREEQILQKDLEELKNKHPFVFKKALNDCNCKQYYLSANIHNNKYGLNDQQTPEGGGTIAQTSSRKSSMKVAFEMYGINHYFIH